MQREDYIDLFYTQYPYSPVVDELFDLLGDDQVKDYVSGKLTFEAYMTMDQLEAATQYTSVTPRELADEFSICVLGEEDKIEEEYLYSQETSCGWRYYGGVCND